MGMAKRKETPLAPSCPPKADPSLAERGGRYMRSGQALRLARPRSGQAMLIAVLALGGAMLGATTIAGFLMAYQIRDTTNFIDSAKSIFAADAGTEWGIYRFTVDSSTPMFTLSNGASANVTCSDASGNVVSCGAAATTQIVSEGTSGETARAFVVSF